MRYPMPPPVTPSMETSARKTPAMSLGLRPMLERMSISLWRSYIEFSIVVTTFRITIAQGTTIGSPLPPIWLPI